MASQVRAYEVTAHSRDDDELGGICCHLFSEAFEDARALVRRGFTVTIEPIMVDQNFFINDGAPWFQWDLSTGQPIEAERAAALSVVASGAAVEGREAQR